MEVFVVQSEAEARRMEISGHLNLKAGGDFVRKMVRFMRKMGLIS
jgi:hypothetical protein